MKSYTRGDLSVNRAILTGLTSIVLAQGIKLPLKYLHKGHLEWTSLTQTGGMPSSHSAGVSSLATYVALKKGTSAIDFAISSIFGLIVMYDAMGIRRHAGEMAVELNSLDAQVEELANKHPGIYHQKRKEALKEQLGHLPREVLAGAVFGALIGAISYAIEPNKQMRKTRRIKGRKKFILV
jgi:acid phosphatase family membrane protein YuiD